MPFLNSIPLTQKKTLLILIVSPILVFSIAFLLLQKPSINLLSADYNYRALSDTTTGLGKSKLTSSLLNNALTINYTLRPGDPYPFISIAFTAKEYEAFDTDGCILQVGIDSDTDHELALRIGMVLEGFTEKTTLDSYIFVEKSIPLKKGRNHFQLPVNEITRTPSWWFTKRGFTEFNLPAYSKSKTGYIAVYDVMHHELNVNRTLQITQLEIQPSYKLFYTYSAIALILYGILIYLVYKLRYRKTNTILVPIDLSLNERKENNYSDRIIHYLAQHYSNPNIKLEVLAREFGLSETQISFEIKNYSGKSFKSYLNFLRIEKAKKLLLESDLQVAEIAFEVGYNSAHHFIRVFKELENTSPSAFRKEYSQR